MKGTLLFLLLFPFHIQAQYVMVLGVAQDGGFPHIGCQEQCQLAHKNPELAKYATSLALVDPENKKWWMFEATPDFDDQLQYFQQLTEGAYPYLPEGIFLTHAHIGHYTGLMFLGREALGASGVNVYALPKMAEFLANNGPWSQLAELNNIRLQRIKAGVSQKLAEEITVSPLLVPHRDEFSETAGFMIQTPLKDYLFIPDIDKWEKWDRNIVKLVDTVDYAFLDATFYEDGELPDRAMSEVPHPFVKETVQLFSKEPLSTKQRIRFIHFNHTNPLLFDEGKRQEVQESGFVMAEQGKCYK